MILEHLPVIVIKVLINYEILVWWLHRKCTQCLGSQIFRCRLIPGDRRQPGSLVAGAQDGYTVSRFVFSGTIQ